MECLQPVYAQGNEWKSAVPSWKASARRVRGQLGGGEGDVGGLRGGGRRVAAGGGGGGARLTGCLQDDLVTCLQPDGLPGPPQLHDYPFMNEMDEISYWVYTKRAPCLMNYDNLIKKQYEAAQISLPLNGSEAVPLSKKKKRKLSLLDDDCTSQDKPQNMYFESSQQKQQTVPSSCKSGTLESDIDFNIKNSSVQDKPKRIKKQKSSRTLHKKNKVVTSTPLRRSQRRLQNGANNTDNLNISFDTCNISYLNETMKQSNCKTDTKPEQRSKKSSSKMPIAQTSLEVDTSALPRKSKNTTAAKEQFEDLSDVSGFTANYIRSTKLHSSAKPHRSLRSKSSRNLVKESQPITETDTQIPKRSTMLMCVNKSINATSEVPHTSMLNCSTDSSQNVINLITTKTNESNCKVNKSTSLLKFVDVRTSKSKGSQLCMKADNQDVTKSDLDVSFPSKSTGNSRYPKRHRKNTETLTKSSLKVHRASLDKRKRVSKGFPEINSKENPDDSTISKTRSGKNLTLALRPPENSLIVYSNSTEKASTVNTLNVGSQNVGLPRNKSKVKRMSYKNSSHLKTSMNISETMLKRDSVRERSGFAACFSDSDDDSDALKQRKFFC